VGAVIVPRAPGAVVVVIVVRTGPIITRKSITGRIGAAVLAVFTIDLPIAIVIAGVGAIELKGVRIVAIGVVVVRCPAVVIVRADTIRIEAIQQAIAVVVEAITAQLGRIGVHQTLRVIAVIDRRWRARDPQWALDVAITVLVLVVGAEAPGAQELTVGSATTIGVRVALCIQIIEAIEQPIAVVVDAVPALNTTRRVLGVAVDLPFLLAQGVVVGSGGIGAAGMICPDGRGPESTGHDKTRQRHQSNETKGRQGAAHTVPFQLPDAETRLA